MFSTQALRNRAILNTQKYFASKELLFGTQARKKLLEGCKQLSQAV
jgi:hypothetical protein